MTLVIKRLKNMGEVDMGMSSTVALSAEAALEQLRRAQ